MHLTVGHIEEVLHSQLVPAGDLQEDHSGRYILHTQDRPQSSELKEPSYHIL